MCGLGTFRQLPSIFCTAGRPSDKFHQHSVQPVDYPSSFVHFLCSRETFHQLPSILLAAKRLSINFRHFCVLPEQLLSTFHAAGHSVNFRQFLLWLEIFRKLLSACGRETYRQIPSTFHAAGRDFVIIC